MSSPAETSSSNPFETARSHLIRRLLALDVPPAHAIADTPGLIRDAANIFDEWLYAVGSQIADRVNEPVDMRVFSGAFIGAVDGNATYEAEQANENYGRRRTLRRASL